MAEEVKELQGSNGQHNLDNYKQTYENFDWEEAKKAFSWYDTGKVNIAYEAIDRHAENPNKKDQVALHYVAPDREEN